MKKSLKVTLLSLCGIVAVLLAVVLVFVGIYFTRIQTMNSIEKLSDYDDGYNLYRMEVKYDYSLDDVINYGIKDNQTMIDAILKDALPLLPVKIEAPSFGCTAFTLTDADGADVSDLGEFYADGKALEGRRFSTTSGSAAPITISATIGGHDVENTAEIIATSNINFTSRLLFENITMTGCQYCPFVKTIIRDVEKDDPAQVICYCIHNSVSTLYQSSQLTQTTLDYANVYCDFMLPGESDRRRAAPKSFVSRNKENHSYDSKYIQPDNLRTLARQQPKNVGIAIESAYTASEVTVHASIGTKQSFSGRAVAVLTKRMSWESDSYKYRVMLAYAPSVEGQELSFEAGKAASFNVTFDLTKLGSVNPDECEIIVFVLNAEGICQSVQYAGVGEAKSY